MHTLNPGVWNGYPTLNDLNSREIIRLIPLVVYLMLVAVIGILGNGLVCHVYRTKYKLSNSQCFILVLSFIDLFSCVFVVPFEIIVVLHQYNFQHRWVCKTSRFFNTLPTVASGFVLLSIALDRYKKVCTPLSRQISFKMAKLMCMGSVICGFLCAWPALVLYGRKSFPVLRYNLNATECSTDDPFKESVFPFINNLTFGMLFLAGTSSLTVLYSLIGRQIGRIAKQDRMRKSSMLTLHQLSSDDHEEPGRHHHSNRNHHKNHRLPSNSYSLRDETSSSGERTATNYGYTPGTVSGASEPPPSSNAPSRINESQHVENGSTDKTVELTAISFESNDQDEGTSSSESDASRDLDRKPGRKGILKNASTASYHQSTGSATTAHSGPVITSPSSTLLSQQKQIRARQMSLLMFFITLAYFLSYLPHILLMLLRAVKTDFVDSMSDEGRATYKFFLRSYAFNSVVNPFIYGACDARFRKACRIVFRNMCRGSRRRPSRRSRRRR